jgi:hypothetical protein
VKRRTDQAIAIGSVAAVAIVPTVLLVVVKAGAVNLSAGPGGPVTTAAAGRSPKGKHSRSPKATSAQPKGVPQGQGVRPAVTPLPTPQATTPSVPSSTKSYTRVTDIQINRVIDTDNGKETAKVVLLPKFGLDVASTNISTKAGIISFSTSSRLVVKGSTESISSDGGKTWQRRQLTATELDEYAKGSDPRRITFAVRSVPGVSKKAEKFGSTHYQVNLTLSAILPYLPKDTAAEITKNVPPETRVAVNLYADQAARPSWFSVAALASAVGSANLVMIFSNYK